MGIVIAFAQQKGGSGKTTVLIHMAHAWARAGKSVGLVDLDPQRTLTQWSALHTEHDLTAVEGAEWRAASDIRETAAQHDVTLVDCPGNASALLSTALRDADLVIVPCQPTAPDIWATNTILDMAKEAKTPAHVVLNRVPARGKQTELIISRLKKSGAPVLKSRLGNRIAFANGLFDGTTALGLARKSKAVDEISVLRAEVDRLIKRL